jgi:hypothetical protein
MTIDQKRRRAGHRRIYLSAAAGLVLLLIVFNGTVTLPAAQALGADHRNDGLGLYAYRSWAVAPRDITIDLMTIKSDKAPIDLFRAVFLIADTLKGRHFGHVTLARAGKPIVRMGGDVFEALGEGYAAGENPVYLVRTLPEKLERPDGKPAFSTWEGGWLGVLGKQMADANTFATDWVSGTVPPGLDAAR